VFIAKKVKFLTVTHPDTLGKLEALADDVEAAASVMANGAALEGGDAARLIAVKAQLKAALDELDTLGADADITDE
jgi:hypothetical protein